MSDIYLVSDSVIQSDKEIEMSDKEYKGGGQGFLEFSNNVRQRYISTVKI